MVEGMEDDDMYFGDECLYTEAQKAALRTRSEMARDSVCANCGAKEQEDSFGGGIVVKKLKKCQGCQDVSYCSRECQKQAWKPSHKNYCRDISVLKAGDIVRLRGLKAQADLNGHLYEIREFDELKGRWRATWVGGSHDLSVKPDNLTRVLTVEERNDLIAHN
ncbi:hypothetical protein BDR26DRAFT_89628 [Obelidium mucronatum]|nr:hypothetical protein BDR26DRAFT_89628 [Obelidium mucronatum]